MAPQTPQQRRANLKFAKQQEAKMGKPRPAKKEEPMPLSKTVIAVLLFVVMGGGVLQILRLMGLF